MGIRRAGLASIVFAALLLAGCGASKGEQRAAFIEFLQTRVLDKPGIHVPQLTDDERSRFGSYADDYAIITDFNKSMSESVSPKLSSAMQAGSITSLGDAVDHVDKLEAAKASIDAIGNALGDTLARADAAHAKLDQPADLKPVYDKTYDRLVTQPAAAFKDIVPVMDKVLSEAIELGHYVGEHRASVRVSGPMIETSDPAIQAAINEKLHSLQSSQQAVQAAQTRMRSVVYGN